MDNWHSDGLPNCLAPAPLGDGEHVSQLFTLVLGEQRVPSGSIHPAPNMSRQVWKETQTPKLRKDEMGTGQGKWKLSE